MDSAALMGLIGQLRDSPAIRGMGEINAMAERHGFDKALVEAMVAALTKFSMAAAMAGKAEEAMELVTHVMTCSAEMIVEVASLKERLAGGK